MTAVVDESSNTCDGDSSSVPDEAIKPEDEVSPVLSAPTYAVVCSFFNQFGAVMGVRMPFSKLERLLMGANSSAVQCVSNDKESDEKEHVPAKGVDKELIDLHLKLLKWVGLKPASFAKWESCLMKFCSYQPRLVEEYVQLERFGYAHAPVANRLHILEHLCERMFDRNARFRDQISNQLPSQLRVLPCGIDAKGMAYYYQQDFECGVRVYCVEQDDQAGTTWTCKAKSRDELSKLVEELTNNLETKRDTKPEESEAEKEVDQSEAPSTSGVVEVDTKIGRRLDVYQSCLANLKEAERKDAAAPNKAEPQQNDSDVDEKPDKQESDSDEEELDGSTFASGRVLRPRNSRARRAAADTAPPPPPQPSQSASSSQSTPTKSADSAKEEGESGSEGSAREESDDVNQESDVDKEDTSDDEFSVPLSRLCSASSSRKARRTKPAIEETESPKKEKKQRTVNGKANPEVSKCKRCRKSNNEHLLLLCDTCDAPWHTHCLRPPLWFVPDDDWFCPTCQNNMLVSTLKAALASLDEAIKKHEAEALKQKRTDDRLKRELQFVSISFENIIPNDVEDDERGSDAENDSGDEQSESGSEEGKSESDPEYAGGGRRRRSRRAARKKKRRRRDYDDWIAPEPIAKSRTRREVKKIDYSFASFDDAIQTAVENIEEAPSMKKVSNPLPSGAGRGKDMANIIEADRMATEAASASADNASADDGDEEDRDRARPPATCLPPAVTARKAKPKTRLCDLDIDNMTESDNSEYKDSGEDEQDVMDDASGSDWSEEQRPTRRSTRLRAGRGGPTQSDEDFVVSGSDWEEEQAARSKRKRPKGRDRKRLSKRRRVRNSSESDVSLVEAARAESDSSEDDGGDRRRKGRPPSSALTRTRRKKVDYRNLVADDEDEEGGEKDGEDEAGEQKEEEQPEVMAKKKRRKINDSDSDEYQQENDAEVEEEEDSGEEEEAAASEDGEEEDEAEEEAAASEDGEEEDEAEEEEKKPMVNGTSKAGEEEAPAKKKEAKEEKVSPKARSIKPVSAITIRAELPSIEPLPAKQESAPSPVIPSPAAGSTPPSRSSPVASTLVRPTAIRRTDSPLFGGGQGSAFGPPAAAHSPQRFPPYMSSAGSPMQQPTSGSPGIPGSSSPSSHHVLAQQRPHGGGMMPHVPPRMSNQSVPLQPEPYGLPQGHHHMPPGGMPYKPQHPGYPPPPMPYAPMTQQQHYPQATRVITATSTGGEGGDYEPNFATLEPAAAQGGGQSSMADVLSFAIGSDT